MVLSVLVGRTTEIAEVSAAISRPEVRLVTLTGPGGAGKTRLALRVADDARGVFTGGVWFVPLNAVYEPAHVLPEIADALHIEVSPGQDSLRVLAGALADRSTLIVLDNLEQVVAAAPDLVTLLGECPGMTLLVTSRERLRVSGEHVLAIAPLPVPGIGLTGLDAIADIDAVRLFTERARAVAPRFRLTEQSAPIVAEICRRLDGLPLAIELAAARVDVLSPAALLARLEKRLVLLTGGGRDLPKRLRTMRSAIAWSHDLLSPSEQVLFRRLAVFPGGFSLEAAEIVCTDSAESATEEHGGATLDVGGVLDGIISLVEKSLIVPHDGQDGERRFEMLQTIREYATEDLAASGEGDAVAKRSARWVLQFAELAHTGLREADAAEWLARLDAEDGNVRAALTWALAAPGGAHIAVPLAGWLWRYWEMRGRLREGREWMQRALSTPGVADVPAGDRARTSLVLGNLAKAMGDLAAAGRAYREAQELWQNADEPQGVADATNNLGLLELTMGNYSHGRALLEQTLGLRRQVNFPYSIALTMSNLADAAILEGDLDQAEAWALEALRIREQLGDHRGIAYLHHALGDIALRRGYLDAARGHLDRSVARFVALDDQLGQAHVQRALGSVAEHARGGPDFVAAASGYQSALAFRHTAGDRLGTAESLMDIASLAVLALPEGEAGDERIHQIWQVLSAGRATYRSAGAFPAPVDRARSDRAWAVLGEQPSIALLAQADDRSASMSLSDVVVIAQQILGWLIGKPGETLPGQTQPVVPSRLSGANLQRFRPVAQLLGPRAGAALRSSLPPFDLTRREREVLEQIALGKSDRQIAAELFISHRTVTTHVTAILGKLNVGSRTAAAATAVRLGMA